MPLPTATLGQVCGDYYQRLIENGNDFHYHGFLTVNSSMLLVFHVRQNTVA